MGNLGERFNPNDYEPDTFDPLPSGNYIAVAEEAALKPTKAEDGSYIEVRWRVSEGEYKGRVLFGRITWQNKNEQAYEIGRKQLSALCHAMEYDGIEDTDHLVKYPKGHKYAGRATKPVRIRVKLRPATAEFEASNDVTGYASIESASAQGRPGTTERPGGSRSAPEGEAPPWQQE